MEPRDWKNANHLIVLNQDDWWLLDQLSTAQSVVPYSNRRDIVTTWIVINGIEKSRFGMGSWNQIIESESNEKNISISQIVLFGMYEMYHVILWQIGSVLKSREFMVILLQLCKTYFMSTKFWQEWTDMHLLS